MKKVVFLLGGNIGDQVRIQNLAIQDIEREIGKVVKRSSLYESKAWGYEDENNYLNQVIVISTGFGPLEILKITQRIEEKLGRCRSGNGYEARTIDIDILFYDGKIFRSDKLTIPHPKLHLRKFTLEPLNEIIPSEIHPVFNKSVKELLKICVDKLSVKKILITEESKGCSVNFLKCNLG